MVMVMPSEKRWPTETLQRATNNFSADGSRTSDRRMQLVLNCRRIM